MGPCTKKEQLPDLKEIDLSRSAGLIGIDEVRRCLKEFFAEMGRRQYKTRDLPLQELYQEAGNILGQQGYGVLAWVANELHRATLSLAQLVRNSQGKVADIKQQLAALGNEEALAKSMLLSADSAQGRLAALILMAWVEEQKRLLASELEKQQGWLAATASMKSCSDNEKTDVEKVLNVLEHWVKNAQLLLHVTSNSSLQQDEDTDMEAPFLE